MARIAVIPQWLNDTLIAQGKDVESVSPEYIKSSIVYKPDVINYYLAQFEILKALLSDYNIDGPHDFLRCYKELFYFEVPDIPELSIYMRDMFEKDVSYEALVVPSVTDPNKIALEIKQSICGKVTYIVASYAPHGNRRKNEFQFATRPIMWNLFKSVHSGLRIEDGTCDKSDSFRAFPLLAQLYVKSLCFTKN